jgi:hypothetical protein
VVGTEEEQAAVVVRVGLVDREHLAGAVDVGRGRIVTGAPVLDHPGVSLGVGVVDVEAPGGRVVGREGDREQPLLAAARDQVGEVDEGVRIAAVEADPLDATAVLDDVEVLIIPGLGLGHVERAVEGPDRRELDPALAVPGMSRRLLGAVPR